MQIERYVVRIDTYGRDQCRVLSYKDAGYSGLPVLLSFADNVPRLSHDLSNARRCCEG